MNKVWRILGLTAFLMIVALFLAGTGTRAAGEAQDGPIVGKAVDFQISPAVGDLPQRPEQLGAGPAPSRINPLADEPDQGRRGTWERSNVPVDSLISRSLTDDTRTPLLGFDFEGTGNPTACGGCAPPDTNGDVGPHHYIQMVNATKVAIFDKAGTPLNTPFDMGDLWSSGTCNSNAGDPIVLYDPLADRWLLSQFASPNHMCLAVSQTPNPLGNFYLYTFDVSEFPDYFKFGVWPDGYYMGANESSYTAYAFERDKMLVGDPAATFQKFTGVTNFLMPSDLDGATPPPAGAPNFFYTFKDSAFHGGGSDRIELYEFHVDWVTPANSTFGPPTSFNVTPFTYTVCGFFNLNCIQQSGTAQRLDAVSEWPMFRFPYRNLGDHQALVGTFTVGGGSGEEGAVPRWFELRKEAGGWTLYQEGTYDPGDGYDRFMGSIAMDQAGNIALGFSVSSSTMNPAIRYATRLASDPLGTLQAEAVLINGGGSQTGLNRWGDYSAMTVDPADDCSFWYTNEYYPVSAATTWKTRVGVFDIPNCAPDITVDPVSISNTQALDVQATLPLTISNTGGADLDWTIDEANSPTIAAGGSIELDSTLAIESSGSRSAAVDPTPPVTHASLAPFSEGFEDITNLPGWAMNNNPDTVGSTEWFQGNTGVFSAQAGPADSYIAANFNNTGGSQISNWLMTPVIPLKNGSTLSFWTRTATPTVWPDRLQVRMSQSGPSVDVGTGPTDVGDFDTLLLDINENLAMGGYPEIWTQYTVTLSGIPAGRSGRLAFRYYIPVSAGPTGSNSNYIGIDTVEYTEAAGKCDSLADIPWASASPTGGLTIGGGSSLVEVTFDSTGLGPSVYTGTLCISSNDPVQPLVEVPMTMTVPISRSVQLSADIAMSGPPGETVTYTLAITNTGNTTDTFDLSASNIWPATPSDSSVTLPASASTTFSVAVDIPAGVADGSSDVATITATSQSDVSATDSVELTTTAEWHRTYLPIMLKN